VSSLGVTGINSLSLVVQNASHLHVEVCTWLVFNDTDSRYGQFHQNINHAS